MEMMVFVLMSVVAVLISPRAANPTYNLNLRHILDLTEKYNETLHEDYFVEDVTELADNGCGNKFFCKVNDILKKHNRSEDIKIVRNLNVFLNKTKVNCNKELKNVTVSEIKKPILDLLKNLQDCIRQRHFIGK